MSNSELNQESRKLLLHSPLQGKTLMHMVIVVQLDQMSYVHPPTVGSCAGIRWDRDTLLSAHPQLMSFDGSLYNRHDIPINCKLVERKASVAGKQEKHSAVLLKLDL